MFLVVFITLVISIIGLYAQVMSIQSAAMYASAHQLAQTMLIWHNAAVNQAHANTPTNISTTGCRMTLSVSATTQALSNNAAPPTCLVAGLNYLASAGLPTGYATSPYTFYSVMYQIATVPVTSYVVTYAHDTTTGSSSGNLYLPDSSGTAVGFSLNDLTVQFARLPSSSTLYGSVLSAGTLTIATPGSTVGTAISYTIPPSIPVGSIAIISSAL